MQPSSPHLNSLDINTQENTSIWGSWQHQLKNTINNFVELCNELNLNFEKLRHHNLEANLAPKFPLKVPRYFANKISKNNYQDPLLLQILPISKELQFTQGYCNDPLQEDKYIKAPGLIHKYSNRILLTMTGACGIHCRYCFRQNFPYDANIVSTKERHLQFDYIKQNSNINEVILSGGDPLCLSNNYLDVFFAELSNLKQINTIRFHSRMPIVIPDRIDEGFINLLKKYSHFKFILVTHCNHPNELDNHIKNKMACLQQNNITVLNQSVLLNNINHDAQTLIDLSYKLFDCHILPYYLHLLDPVSGTQHFNVELTQAKELMKQMASILPGYLLPKLVQEIPNQPNKTVIC